jgi:hypothetical protein
MMLAAAIAEMERARAEARQQVEAAKAAHARALGTPKGATAALALERAQLNLRMVEVRLRSLKEEQRLQDYLRRVDAALSLGR